MVLVCLGGGRREGGREERGKSDGRAEQTDDVTRGGGGCVCVCDGCHAAMMMAAAMHLRGDAIRLLGQRTQFLPNVCDWPCKNP